jgi:hypothetical protein
MSNKNHQLSPLNNKYINTDATYLRGSTFLSGTNGTTSSPSGSETNNIFKICFHRKNIFRHIKRGDFESSVGDL